MIITSKQDLIGMKTAGMAVKTALEEIKSHVRPGVTTEGLDGIAKEVFRRLKIISAPIETYNFPGCICISVNEGAAHGVPNKRLLNDGDIVNLDVSGHIDGYYADCGESVIVGEANSRSIIRLRDAAREALESALRVVGHNRRISDLGRAMQQTIRDYGCTPIRNLAGHGIGRKLHDTPSGIRAYYRPYDRRRMKFGMALAIESFVTLGSGELRILDDGWTTVTTDRMPAAQFENTILVCEDRAEILTKA